MRFIRLIGSALGLSLLTISASAVERIEHGNVVLEAVPPIPVALAETTNRYQQTRSASFAGWLGSKGGILISTRFGETAQVHRVDTPGSARTQLTFFAEPVAEAHPAPDGKRFLFTKDSGGNEFYQVFEFDLDSGDYRLLSDGQSRNTDLLWSNKGQRFAYSTTRRNGKDTDVVIGTPGSKAIRNITASEGAWNALDFSPADDRVLLSKYVSINESELYLADLSQTGDGAPRLQRFHNTDKAVSFSSARFARDGRGIYSVSDEDSDVQRLRFESLDGGKAKVLSGDARWDVDSFVLSNDGRLLAYTLNADGISELHLLDLKSGRALPVPKLPIGVLSQLAFDPTSRRLGFNLNSARSPSDVFTFDIAAKPVLVRWTRSETGGLNAASFTEPELIHVASFDGLQVPAFYYRGGARGETGTRRPLLIQIHGGPEAQALPVFNPLIEYYVRELGIDVLVPNVRGSAGYGKRYLQLDDGRLREDSVRDIGALLDWAKSQPGIRADRIAVMGGSYGGYMTLASMTHYNDRLRGGVDIVGISNFVTFLTNTQDYRRQLRRVEYGDESDPDMRQFLERISPTAQASKITRPLFVIQGANDPRVPASEAEQMVKTVRGNGGEVWYLLAKDEGHGFRKKSNRDLYNNAVILFLQKILLE